MTINLTTEPTADADTKPQRRRRIDIPREQLVAGAYLCAFALIWICTLYWIQRATLIGAQSGGPRFDYFAPKIRLLLDGLFVATLCAIFRWWILASFAAICSVMGVALMTHVTFFERPLSLLTVMTSGTEAGQFGGFALDLVPWTKVSILLAILLVQWFLLWKSRTLKPAWQLRAAAGSFFAVAFVVVYCVTLYLDPLDAILTNRGVARLGIIRGYAGPWFAEWHYLDDPRLKEKADERARMTSNELAPREASIPIHDRLVIIQAESLDFNVLDHRVDGREVTPFLNQLKERSMFFRVLCYHINGSADADFTMLAGGAPAQNVLNYNLPNTHYINPLPKFLSRQGFQTYAFHGNTGVFYNRRAAFEKMGFADIFFREDLESVGTFEIDRLGLRDKDLLTFSALKLRTATQPTCHFIITLTSHTPYIFLRPEENLIVPHPKDAVDRYLNHVHYLDSCLRDYITSLGKGVTVVIYADHPTEVSRGDFQRAREGENEYVPVFIYNTDQDLSKLQQTRGTIATDGSLKMLDISSFLRSSIEASAKNRRDPVATKPAVGSDK